MMLNQAGFHYDSSLYPGLLPPYHFRFWGRRRPYQEEGGAVEIPLFVWGMMGLPFNGFFLRLLPEALLGWGLKKSPAPLVLYVHAWEFTELQPGGFPKWFVRGCGSSFAHRMSRLLAASGRKNWFTLKDLRLSAR